METHYTHTVCCFLVAKITDCEVTRAFAEETAKSFASPQSKLLDAVEKQLDSVNSLRDEIRVSCLHAPAFD